MPINFQALNLQPNQGGIISTPSAPVAQDSGLGGFLTGLAKLGQGLKDYRLSKATQSPSGGVSTIAPSSPTGPVAKAGVSALMGALSPAAGTVQAVTNAAGAVKSIWDAATSKLGIKEGDPALNSFLSKANPNLDPTVTPWCAGFVGSVLNASGLKGTGSLAAKSYLNYGTPTDKPSQGDIVVFNDMSGRNDPSRGHVGFVKSINNDGTVTVLGGNQSNQVSVKNYPISAVAGYRHPPTGGQIQAYANKNNIRDPQQLASLTQNQSVKPLVSGNIDLNNRPLVKNKDGSYSTVYTMTMEIDGGRTVLVPRVINGKIVSEKEAKEHFRKTGQHLGIFKDQKDADQYDQQMHQKQGWTGSKNKWG